ncbi:hypothetical protein N7532_006443 [Penicillium argentinense]|uniref:Uncharacterized protein n=1 Tax=Penicillium argentinense TaxID=1131581 RepID=A0A9W9FGA5_9EURO|nr:uncharacterized protein N7532_006443 [Penicillium argentinense]KAJ5099442.1 hypothetical protein N7532_006443 [Penicillium argentinense]
MAAEDGWDWATVSASCVGMIILTNRQMIGSEVLASKFTSHASRSGSIISNLLFFGTYRSFREKEA